jgi:protein SCO1/2
MGRRWAAFGASCIPFFVLACRVATPLPIYADFPNFEAQAATSQNLLTLHRKDLVGHPFVADFFYTRCSGPCPLMSQNMSRLQGQLPPAVRLVSFSVDPDGDNPLVLQAYARLFSADPQRWYFVRIRKADLLAFLRAVLSPAHAFSPIVLGHSTQFVLVDDSGRIRGYYDSTGDKDLIRLEQDARRLD